MNLFIAYVTGQNQSNIPPILTFAEPQDRVLWVRSGREAQDADKWRRTKAVLERRGLISEKVDLDECSWWMPQNAAVELLNLAAHPVKQGCERVFLVANGGPKINMIAIEEFRRQAFSGGLPVDILYGELSPVALLHFETAHPERGLQPIAFKNVLNFHEWLALNGWERDDASNPRRRFVSPDQCEPLDHTFFRKFFSDTKLAELVSRWRVWSDGVYDRSIAAKEWTGQLVGALRSAEKPATASHRKLLNTVERFIRDAITHCAVEPFADGNGECAELQAAGLLKPPARPGSISVDDTSGFGDWFEDAVAWRFLKWLSHPPQEAVREIIAEVGFQTAVRRIDTKTTAGAFDIAVLLKNAAVVHLECKGSFKRFEEIEAQTMKLQMVAGSVARQFVVVPWFESDDLRLKAVFEEAREKVKHYQTLCEWNKSIELLRYTFEPNWVAERTSAPREGSFEAALDNIFGPLAKTPEPATR